MVASAVALVREFARTRWGTRFPDRPALLRWQERRVAAFLAWALPRAPFYRAHAGRALHELPVVDKRVMMAEFAGLNTRGIALQRALDAALEAERSRDFRPVVDGVTVGLSSGTSGARGVFLVGPDERARWAGLVLARLLTPASLRQLASPWRPPLRVAFFLRATSNLYTTVAGRRLAFEWYDLLAPVAQHTAALAARPPDVLVAPPTVLRRLAEAQRGGALRIAPRQVVSVAEVLEPGDARVVEACFGVAIQQVYQATEGFLGATCGAGRIHLEEEHVLVEPEWLDGERRRFVPVVTDFSRHTQLVVRYRLDDVLRADDRPCPCGRVSRVIEAIEGRADEVLWRPACRDGAPVALFPDVVRRALALAGGGVRDHRLEQHGDAWRLRLDADDPAVAAERVREELGRLWRGAEVRPAALELLPWVPQPLDQKRRRIRCVAR